MKLLKPCARIDLTFDISWEKNGINHTEHYFVDAMNSWRDVVKGSILENIFSVKKGETITIQAGPGELVPQYREDKIIHFKKKSQPLLVPSHRIGLGRYYPQGMISGVPGIFKGNMTPFRIAGINDDHITADLNHPMAKVPMEILIRVVDQARISEERGGNCTDWLDLALSGPGMQSRSSSQPTHFLSQGALDREDCSSDNKFYAIDRFVSHVDDTARRNLSGIYQSFLNSNDTVLDLMAGWESHLPKDMSLGPVHGLGMNENELEKNSQLASCSVQDLNENARLKFDDHVFDAVVCSLSIEYLVDPLAVFNQIARVLKPGGIFIVTFSNRWFPEKGVRIWKELHNFERMGLVLEYFFETKKFEKMSTISMRGYPRPLNDKYSREIKDSDPIFAVTGKTNQS